MAKKAKLYKPKKSKAKKKFTFNSTGRAKGYDSQWEKYRRRFLFHNPYCYVCPNEANVIDHVIPARVDFEKYFWEVTNLIPLCKHCHDTITGKFDRHDPPKTDEKLKWIDKWKKHYNNKKKVKIVPLKLRGTRIE